MEGIKDDLVQEWSMIPPNAFLFFPQGEEVRSGSDQKTWRKIFQAGDPYDQFQQKKLAELDKKLATKQFTLHMWFDRANKLRFLQANKFKISDTVKSIEQACIWRAKHFPLKATAEVTEKLKSGCFYFCGRDLQYRPIMVADIARFKEGDEEVIPSLLMVILEFMLSQLLIEGQVENYVLILDLESVNSDMKSTVMKIVQFTSNTYRSRLFASYLLGMPTLLNFAWNAIASTLVSENTLKKIKVSKKLRHDDMWLHIDPAVIDVRYGGQRSTPIKPFWPPSREVLTYCPDSGLKQNHISRSEYNKKFKAGQLANRKVLKSLLNQVDSKEKKAKSSQKEIEEDKQRVVMKNGVVTDSRARVEDPRAKVQDSRMERQAKFIQNKAPLGERQGKQASFSAEMVRREFVPPIRRREFELFFENRQFLQQVGLVLGDEM